MSKKRKRRMEAQAASLSSWLDEASAEAEDFASEDGPRTPAEHLRARERDLLQAAADCDAEAQEYEDLADALHDDAERLTAEAEAYRLAAIDLDGLCGIRARADKFEPAIDEKARGWPSLDVHYGDGPRWANGWGWDGGWGKP